MKPIMCPTIDKLRVFLLNTNHKLNYFLPPRAHMLWKWLHRKHSSITQSVKTK